MESLFLSLGCFIDVREALNDTGDPKRARETIAPVTDRIASDKQAQHLETAHDALQSNPGLRTDPKVQWESKLTGGVTGNTVIRGVERLAKDCYGVEKKEELPDEYLRFESGGFANLVEDLFHGSWEG